LVNPSYLTDSGNQLPMPPPPSNSLAEVVFVGPASAPAGHGSTPSML